MKNKLFVAALLAANLVVPAAGDPMNYIWVPELGRAVPVPAMPKNRQPRYEIVDPCIGQCVRSFDPECGIKCRLLRQKNGRRL